MARTRISTTVDSQLLAMARRALADAPDSVLIEKALNALLARRRTAEIDSSYAVYDAHPIDEPDEWGDLGSFRLAAGSS